MVGFRPQYLLSGLITELMLMVIWFDSSPPLWSMFSWPDQTSYGGEHLTARKDLLNGGLNRQLGFLHSISKRIQGAYIKYGKD